MIDGLKIQIIGGNHIELLKNPLLDFASPLVHNTGEIKERNFVIYKNLKFSVVKGNHGYISRIKGSIHKYWCGANYNDFTYQQLTDSILDLCKKININPRLAVLRNLEYGVNIELSESPETLLNLILNYKGQPFTTMPRKRGKVMGIECHRQRYTIKIYDKGKENNLDKHLVRIEIKVIRMKHLESTGIHTLADLLNHEKLTLLTPSLAYMFNELLIHDKSIDSSKLNASDQMLLIEGYNSKFWVDLLKSNRNKFNKRRARFRLLIERHSETHLQRNITRQIAQKWNELLQTNDKTRNKLTPSITG